MKAIDKLKAEVLGDKKAGEAWSTFDSDILLALLDFAEAADICFFCDDIDAEETRLQLLNARAALEAACEEKKP